MVLQVKRADYKMGGGRVFLMAPWLLNFMGNLLKLEIPS